MIGRNLNKNNTEDGLTLIELSIALIVIGLLTVAFLQIYGIQQEKRLKELQRYKIFTISDGLARYLSENQHYPCPARRDLAVSDSNFGDSTGVGNSCNNTVVAAGTCADIDGNGIDDYCVATNAGKRIRIGSLPYKDIGVGKEDVIDVYGNQFTYAVVEEQATVGLYVPRTSVPAAGVPPPANHNIIVRDYSFDPEPLVPLWTPPANNCDPYTGICRQGVNVTRPVEMVFFSHGKGEAGSYTASGVANSTTCPAAAQIDSENCDDDATFVTDLYSVRSAAASGVADDNLTYNLLKWIYIWDTAAGNSKSIYNRDSGNMGIGIEDGDEKLHVIGNLRADAGANPPDPITGEQDMGKLQVRDLCDENETDCFTSEVLGGDAASTERLQCPPDFFVKAIANGQAVCVSALGDQSANDCDGNVLDFANGIAIDEATGAITLSCDSAI